MPNIDTGALLTINGGGFNFLVSVYQRNVDCHGVTVVVDITAITGILTVTIQGVDQVSGKMFPLLSSAPLTAIGTTVLRVFPGAPVLAHASANDQLPFTWNVRADLAGTAASVHATIGASVIE
jgi:hypothetical protein